MNLGLENKVALVTGAASKKGIGRSIALILAEEGADIALADLDFDGVEAVSEEIKEMGRKALAFKVDQGVYDQVEETASKIHQEMGSVDILINNAAVTKGSGSSSVSTRKLPISSWEKQISVNLNGVFYWTHKVLPFMIQKGWGRIINVSSVAGIIGGAGVPAYAASKGGMVAFTKSVAVEVARSGVTVNAVSLGAVDTEIYSGEFVHRSIVETIQAMIPQGRMADPVEIAHVVAFLASDKSSYIQGANIVIDGGVTLGISKATLGLKSN